MKKPKLTSVGSLFRFTPGNRVAARDNPVWATDEGGSIEIVGRLTKGDLFVLLEAADGGMFVKVLLSSGLVGYVGSWLLDNMEEAAKS